MVPSRGITPALSETLSTTADVLDAAQNAGTTTAFDLNYRTKLWSPDEAAEVYRACPSVDLLVVAERDANAALDRTGDAETIARDLAAEYGFEATAITRGSDGALAHADGTVTEHPTFESTDAHPVGTGDSFVGGFLSQDLSGGTVADGLAWGAATAALKRTIPGDIASYRQTKSVLFSAVIRKRFAVNTVTAHHRIPGTEALEVVVTRAVLPVGDAMRNAKIVCTLGPASFDRETIRGLADAGMSVARMNASHGNVEHRSDVIDSIRAVDDATDEPLAAMLDLQGPEVRTADIDEPIQLTEGSTIRYVVGDDATPEEVGLSQSITAVEPGDRVLLDDGRIETTVERVEDETVFATVENGGELAARKGVNVPGVELDLPTITENDEQDSTWRREVSLISWPPRTSVTARMSTRSATPSRPRRGDSHHRQNRARRRGRQPRRNHPGGPRRDGRPRRPRRRVPPRRGAHHPEAHHPQSAGRGRTGHHRDRDARLDGPLAPPDPRGGVRRGQRRPRRHRRRDALRRDRSR